MNHPRNPGFLNPNRRGLGSGGLGFRVPCPEPRMVSPAPVLSTSRSPTQSFHLPRLHPPVQQAAFHTLRHQRIMSALAKCPGRAYLACMSCSRAPAWPACLIPEHLHGLHALFQSTWPACRVPEHQHGLQPCSLFLTGRSGLQPACLLPKGMQGPERASLLQSSSSWRMGLLAWSGLLARSGLHPAFTPSPWVHAWP